MSRFYSVFLHFTMQLIRLTNYAFWLKILLFYFPKFAKNQSYIFIV